MKIVFWNIYKNNYTNIKKILIDLLACYSLDLLLISEYENLDLNKIQVDLRKTDYEYEEGILCKKVLLIKKINSDFVIPTDDKRFIVSQSFNYNITIVGVHLEDQMNSNNIVRYESMYRLCEALKSLPNKNNNIILIGDFNCLPTDDILLSKRCICCIPYKEEVRKLKYNYVFYNPTLLALNENEQMYGGLRYIGKSNSLIWYPFDQVMISKSLIDNHNYLKYLKKISENDLVTKNNVPKKTISDHLPLFFEIEL